MSSSYDFHEQLLALHQVERMAGFKKTKIYQLIKDGSFPPPFKIGSSARWRLSDVHRWIEDACGSHKGVSRAKSSKPNYEM